MTLTLPARDVALDHHLGHGLLHRAERPGQHRLRIHPAWIDVVLLHRQHDLGDHRKGLEPVAGRRRRRRSSSPEAGRPRGRPWTRRRRGRWAGAGAGRCARAKEMPAASASATAEAAAKRRRLFMWGRILGGVEKDRPFHEDRGRGAVVQGDRPPGRGRSSGVEGNGSRGRRHSPACPRTRRARCARRGGATGAPSVQSRACRSTGSIAESPPVRGVDDLVAWFREREHPAADWKVGIEYEALRPGRRDPRPGPLRRAARDRGGPAGLLPLRLRARSRRTGGPSPPRRAA